MSELGKARPSFIAHCANCGAEVIRSAKNGSNFKCFDCRRKDKLKTTRDWYRKPGNREFKAAWDKQYRQKKRNAANTRATD
jgi:DNA-directed RNA polymerase subunit RPC12/RpoP